MATIDDVAKLAGVSIATVSRVFNNSPLVSEKARQ
ncbi:regulatory protein LacI, partial [Thermoanaerobacter ethanolicus JW 200]